MFRLTTIFILTLLSFLSLWLNQSISLLIGNIRTDTLTAGMIFMTNKGMLGAVTLYIVYLFLSKHKKHLTIAVIAASAATAGAFLLKQTYRIPRPYLILGYEPIVVATGQYSFPSMHSAFVFSLLPVIHKTRSNRLTATAVLLAALIAFSRLYLGVHTAADIFFGALAGFLIGSLIIYLEEKWHLTDKFYYHIKNTFEFRRQIAHAAIGIGLIVAIRLKVVEQNSLAVLLLIGAAASILSRYYNLPIISQMLDYFERDIKRRRFPGQGAFFLVLGSFLALKLYPLDIACAAISIMAIGDSATNIFGSFFGKIKNPLNPRKNIEGTLFAIGVSTVAAWFFVPFWPAFFASAIAMLIESLDLKISKYQIDDNLFIPLIAGAVMSYMI